MLRKKLIALGLIGMTVAGVTVSTTTISIAAPTNLAESDNMMKDIAIRGVDSLEKIVNEGNYEKANSWRKQVNHQLTALSEMGEDVADLQKKFDELSKKIDVLGENKKKIDTLKEGISDSIKGIIYSLNNKDYENIPDQFKYLSEDIDKLSKSQPIDKSLLDRVAELKDRYDNREKLDKAEKIVKSLSPQLDDLSKAVKEKNLNESVSLRQQIDSEMKNLVKLSKVPSFIQNRFDLYSEKVDKLIALKEETKELKNQINNLLNEADNFINVKDYTNAKESVDKALEKVSKLDRREPLEDSLTNKLRDVRNRFDNMEKVAPAKPLAEPVYPVNAINPVDSVVQPVNPVEKVAKSEKSKEVAKVNAVNLESKENAKNEEVKVNNKVIEAKKNNEQALNNVAVEKANVAKQNQIGNKVTSKVSNQEKATENQNVLPKTGSPIGAEGLLGLGAVMSALGAMTLRKFRKN